MRVAEVMHPDVAAVAPEESVQAAAQAMADLDLQAALVGSESALAGVLTQRDILIRVVAAGLIPADTPVSQVMSTAVFTCTPDEDTDAVAARMDEHMIDQLPVLDGAGRLVGIITRGAIAQAATAQAATDQAGAAGAAASASPATVPEAEIPQAG